MDGRDGGGGDKVRALVLRKDHLPCQGKSRPGNRRLKPHRLVQHLSPVRPLQMCRVKIKKEGFPVGPKPKLGLAPVFKGKMKKFYQLKG